MSRPSLQLSIKKPATATAVAASSSSSASERIKQEIARLEGQEEQERNSNNNANVSAVVVATDTTPRYVVRNAHLPSEAFWSTCSTWRELVIKTQQVWGFESPFFTFTTTNALDRVVTFRLTCTADFEAVWSNPDAPAMSAAAQRQLGTEAEQYRMSPFSLARSSTGSNVPNSKFFGTKLTAHDHRISKLVAHSSELYQYGIRPHVTTGLLAFWPARYCIRHTVTDEVILVVEAESPSWGFAVQKAQTQWGVLRPLFRYIDDIDGERTVISIVTAEDFQLWFKRRRPLWPELLVFEHAAQSLLNSQQQQQQQINRDYGTGDDAILDLSSIRSAVCTPPVIAAAAGRRSGMRSAGSMGVAPLEAEIPREVGYFPSSTNPNFMVEKLQNRSTNAAEAQQLLSSFRPESVGGVSERGRVEEERRYQQARERHLRQLEKALTAADSSPRRGQL